PDSADSPDSADTPDAPTKTRRIVLHVHLSAAALTGASGGTARVENLGGLRLVTTDQVREWCTNPHTTITVRPVIDLADSVGVDHYEIPESVRERVVLTNPTCVFPWCARQARRCDLDHVVPYDPQDPGGATSTDNLAPLCRGHHRLKTHARWRYRRLGPTTFVWTSPHGLRFLRDHTGTVSLDEPVGDPRPPEV
ncbi:MAG: HNH endonuclease, partial [Nocardioides sp.]